jgi:hypothetical protein
MLTRLRKRFGSFDSWLIGAWHECRDQPGLRLKDVDTDVLRQVLLDHGEGLELVRARDHEIVRLIACKLADGSLRILRGAAERTLDDELLTQALQQHDTQADFLSRLLVTSRPFAYDTERLCIVSAARWRTLRDRCEGRYEVVPRTKALRTLDRMAHAWDQVDGDERQALQQAQARLLDDSASRTSDGVILLRIVPRLTPHPQAQRNSEAMTPSQLAGRHTEEELHWIAIELLDEDDQPVPEEPYEIELPDGSTRTGRLDREGRASVTGIVTPGSCRVCFPGIDAREWRPA